MTNTQLLMQLKQFYQPMTTDKLSMLPQLYADNVSFADPIQKVQGISKLQRYFSHTLENVKYCHFVFQHELISGQQIYLNWHMQFAHPKLNNGQEVTVPGVSYLVLHQDGKIQHHTDYYDMGAMLYEHIPLLGWVTHKVKQRLTLA